MVNIFIVYRAHTNRLERYVTLDRKQGKRCDWNIHRRDTIKWLIFKKF